MKKLILALALAAVSLAVFVPSAPAQARTDVIVGFNYGYPHRHYHHYYPYYYPYYYAPPPVVYMPPPVYVQPPPVAYAYAPVMTGAPGSLVASQTSPTFADSEGHTCRQYQSGSVSGIACLQPDGTWRVVQ